MNRPLELQSYYVKAVADSSAVLKVPPFEKYRLLLTDFVMLIVYGIALALKAFREHPEVRILMLICYAEQGRTDLNLDVLNQGDLMKIFAIDDLTVAVERILQAK